MHSCIPYIRLPSLRRDFLESADRSRREIRKEVRNIDRRIGAETECGLAVIGAVHLPYAMEEPGERGGGGGEGTQAGRKRPYGFAVVVTTAAANTDRGDITLGSST